MSKKWQILIGGAVIGALALALLIGGTVVLAQGPTPNPWGSRGAWGNSPSGWGHMGGGMMGGWGHVGGGMMGGWGYMGEMHDEVWGAIAERLGLTVEELQAEFASGETLAALAEERDVTREALVEAFLSARREWLAEAVESGLISQEQADRMLEEAVYLSQDDDGSLQAFEAVYSGAIDLGWQGWPDVGQGSLIVWVWPPRSVLVQRSVRGSQLMAPPLVSMTRMPLLKTANPDRQTRPRPPPPANPATRDEHLVE